MSAQLDLTPRCPVCGEPDEDHREPGMVELGVDAVPCEVIRSARESWRVALTEDAARGLIAADLEDWT